MTTILIVDDSRVSREIIKVFLVGRQARVLEAADGREALSLTKEHRPDLVLADLEMPELDGVELCEAIHADPRLRGTPVLVLSGSATPERARRCRAAGALEILSKPVRPEALLAAVDRHLPKAAEANGQRQPAGASPASIASFRASLARLKSSAPA